MLRGDRCSGSVFTRNPISKYYSRNAFEVSSSARTRPRKSTLTFRLLQSLYSRTPCPPSGPHLQMLHNTTWKHKRQWGRWSDGVFNRRTKFAPRTRRVGHARLRSSFGIRTRPPPRGFSWSVFTSAYDWPAGRRTVSVGRSKFYSAAGTIVVRGHRGVFKFFFFWERLRHFFQVKFPVSRPINNNRNSAIVIIRRDVHVHETMTCMPRSHGTVRFYRGMFHPYVMFTSAIRCRQIDVGTVCRNFLKTRKHAHSYMRLETFFWNFRGDGANASSSPPPP